MQVIGLLFYLFGAIDFLLWLLLNINLTHTSWSPLAAGLLGHVCFAFGAVSATVQSRASEPAHDAIGIDATNAASQAQSDSDLTMVQAISSAV